MMRVCMGAMLGMLCAGRVSAQETGFLCPCDTCVAKDNSVADCESFGVNCGCFQGRGCETCVRSGNSVADCEGFGLSCDDDGGHGYDGGGQCGDIASRSAEMTATCCDEATEDCSGGYPTTCNIDCARVLLPFFLECSEELGDAFGMMDHVVALCRAAKPAAPSPPAPPGPSPPAPPSPPPATITSPVFEVVSGQCTVSPGGECMRSPNYPNNYMSGADCVVSVSGSGGVRATQFSLEHNYDFVTLSGRQYSGSGEPLSTAGAPVLDGSTIRFHSDTSNVLSGFEICGTALNCGQHGTSNAEGNACTCEANYFGRAVPEVGRAVCDEGPFPTQYRVSGCADPTNCGVFSRVQAQCTGGNCDVGNPTTCGYAPVYEKDAGLLPANPTPGGNRLLYRWVLQDGSSEWRVGRGALLDCIGIPSARAHGRTGSPGVADDNYAPWVESASSGWIDSSLTVTPVEGGGH